MEVWRRPGVRRASLPPHDRDALAGVRISPDRYPSVTFSVATGIERLRAPRQPIRRARTERVHVPER